MLSQTAAKRLAAPYNAVKLENPTHLGVAGTPGDGPYIRLWLEVEGDTIKGASYECNGCPSSISAAGMLCRVVTGRSLEEISQMTPKDLLAILGGLPEGKEYYAELAIQALHNAKLVEESL